MIDWVLSIVEQWFLFLEDRSTMDDSVEYIIIGAGVAGLVTAYHLAERGQQNGLVLERGSQVALHASTKNSGLIHHYHPEEKMRSALGEAISALRDYQAQKETIFFRGDLPSLFLLPEEQARELSEESKPVGQHRTVDSSRIPASLKPHRGVQEGVFVEFQGDGLLDARRFMDQLAEDVRRTDVSIELETEYAGASREEKGWIVETSSGTYRGTNLINASGAFMDNVDERGGMEPIGFSPTVRHLFYSGVNLLPPDYGFYWDAVNGVYFRHDGKGTLMCACDEHPSSPGDLEVLEAPEQTMKDQLFAHYPQFSDVSIEEFWACQRTGSPTGVPVIETDAEQPTYHRVGGLKGHGMSAGFWVGRKGADLLANPSSS